MVNVFIVAYLIAPVLLGLAVALHALLRGKDRVHLASICLVLCCFFYSGVAYSLSLRDPSNPLAYILGFYALVIYASVAGLAIYMHRLAWRVAVGAFALHLLGTLAAIPSVLASGQVAVLALAASAVLGAAGLWASLHRGTKAAIFPTGASEARAGAANLNTA